MVKILQVGFGPLGRKIYAMSLSRPGEEVVGVVDLDPEITGHDAGVVAGSAPSGLTIEKDLDTACDRSSPEVAVVSTVSDLATILPLLETLIAKGLHVISTCEELLYPYLLSPGLARRLDESARANGVAVLGTGVNPGFLMDALPAFLTAVCSRVDRIEVRRFQDAQHRRLPFQHKIGAGLSPAEFEIRKIAGTLRHVGLTESMHFLARQLGWEPDHTEDIISPVIATREIVTQHLRIPKGYAAGVRQEGRAFFDGEMRINLVFQASVGERESYDQIAISGEPSFTSRIGGGIHGDIATCAITLNAVHRIMRHRGLVTMADIGLVTCVH